MLNNEKKNCYLQKSCFSLKQKKWNYSFTNYIELKLVTFLFVYIAAEPRFFFVAKWSDHLIFNQFIFFKQKSFISIICFSSRTNCVSNERKIDEKHACSVYEKLVRNSHFFRRYLFFLHLYVCVYNCRC